MILLNLPTKSEFLSMTILDEIVEHKKQVVSELKKSQPIERLKDDARSNQQKRSLLSAMKSSGDFHFICEVKKASPSKGIIQPDLNPTAQASIYEKGGASAISVLTDEKYFLGSLDYLRTIKKTVNIPVLRKDFIIDTYQLYESKAAGADLILLIARILSKEQLADFYRLAGELNLEVLIELAGPDEINKLPGNLDHALIGINNRNLHTFEVNLQNSIDIKPYMPKGVPCISESGIHNAEDCKKLYEHGFKGALIGESLMRAGSPLELLRQMKMGVGHVQQT
jgi:indole-3-glycerol phosphate synthase